MNYMRLVPTAFSRRSKPPEMLKISKQWSTTVRNINKIEPNKPFTPPEKLKKQFKDSSMLSLFPRELLRKTHEGNIKHLYLASDSDTPQKIANHLVNLPDLTIPFVETNPGPGLLTRLLIESKMTDIRIFEGYKEFMRNLQDNFADVYPDRVKLKHADIICLNKYAYADRFDNGRRVEQILSGLPVKEWQNGINFRLYGATGNLNFFKTIICSIIFQHNIMSYGRCELYLVMPALTYIKLTCSNKAGYASYRSTSILFQILFEYELLDKFPRKDFLPNFTSKTNYMTKIKCVDPQSVYFVKVVPRQNLFQVCPPKVLQELWHFIEIHYLSRSHRIVPLLEKLIPSCGPSLLLNTQTPIRPKPTKTRSCCEIPSVTNPSMTLSIHDYYENLDIYTQFGDLSPSQLLTLFYQFRNMPGYHSSTFLSSLESALLRQQTSPADVLDDDAIENTSNNDEDCLEDKADVIEPVTTI